MPLYNTLLNLDNLNKMRLIFLAIYMFVLCFRGQFFSSCVRCFFDSLNLLKMHNILIVTYKNSFHLHVLATVPRFGRRKSLKFYIFWSAFDVKTFSCYLKRWPVDFFLWCVCHPMSPQLHCLWLTTEVIFETLFLSTSAIGVVHTLVL